MLKRLLCVLAAPVLMLSGALSTAPIVGADDDDEQIALNAKVRDSLFYLQIDVTGKVYVPPEQTQDGKPLWSEPTTVTFTCSGFAVDSAGFVATAGHCVDPDSDQTFESIREKFVISAVDAGLLVPTAAVDFLNAANEEQWAVEGERRGSLPDVSVQVIQPPGPNRVVDQFVTAQIVDFQPFSDGDNAVLKVPTPRPLRPLVIANKVPEPGQTLTAVGWPGSVSRVIDRSRIQEPSFKSGTASSVQVKRSGAQSTEINADVSGGMSGGPTVDNDTGEVLGVNSYGIVGESQAFNFITNAPELRSFLDNNGVTLAQSTVPDEKSFPWWLVIGVVVVVAVAVGLVLVLRRRQKRASATPGGYPPGPPPTQPMPPAPTQ